MWSEDRRNALAGAVAARSFRARLKACVPNVCQLRKANLNSTALFMRSELCKLLIQGTLSQYGEPQATSAKKPKTGFVISRSPVRSRRVAPSIWLEINQLQTNLKIDIAVELHRVGTQIRTQNWGPTGAKTSIWPNSLKMNGIYKVVSGMPTLSPTTDGQARSPMYRVEGKA